MYLCICGCQRLRWHVEGLCSEPGLSKSSTARGGARVRTHVRVYSCVHGPARACVCACVCWLQVCMDTDWSVQGPSGHGSPRVSTPTLLRALQGAWLCLCTWVWGDPGCGETRSVAVVPVLHLARGCSSTCACVRRILMDNLCSVRGKYH